MELQQWMSSIGLSFDPVLDNKIHRCDEFGTKKSDHIWYIGSTEYTPSGKERTTLTVGNHRTGEQWYYSSGKASDYNEEERAYYAKKQKQAEEQSEKEKVLNQERAASQAQTLWDSAGNADTAHPYLIKKGISGVDRPGIRQVDDTLLIPMRDIEGKLWGIQRIWPDGTKRFLTGQRKSGTYFCFEQSSSDPIWKGKTIVCEGFATGASIHLCTGARVCVSFDSGNLCEVAKIVSVTADSVIICGDDDRWPSKGNSGVQCGGGQVQTEGLDRGGEGDGGNNGPAAERVNGDGKEKRGYVQGNRRNIGREKAIEAADAVGGIAVFPDFSRWLK